MASAGLTSLLQGVDGAPLFIGGLISWIIDVVVWWVSHPEAGGSILLEQTIIGLQSGFVLFLIASGLTVILGILDVLNLAHGELYAVGAYVAFAVFGFVVGTQNWPASIMAPPTPGGVGTLVFALTIVVFIALVVLTILFAASLFLPFGMVLESTLLEPIYERDEVYQLVLTFALLLVLTDVRRIVFGDGSSSIFSIRNSINQIPTGEIISLATPTATFLVMAVVLVLAVILFWFFDETKTGRIIRATAINREMSTALGVDPDRIFTLVFAFGAFLAGFAGGLQFFANQAIPGMGGNALILSFVVIVVGGLGSLKGSFVGAILIGIVSTYAVQINANYALGLPAEVAAPFAIMVVVLLIKPEGLYGSWGEME